MTFPIIRWSYGTNAHSPLSWRLWRCFPEQSPSTRAVPIVAAGCEHWWWRRLAPQSCYGCLHPTLRSAAQSSRSVQEWQESAFNTHLLFCKEKCLKTELRGWRHEEEGPMLAQQHRSDNLLRLKTIFLLLKPASVSEPEPVFRFM